MISAHFPDPTLAAIHSSKSAASELICRTRYEEQFNALKAKYYGILIRPTTGLPMLPIKYHFEKEKKN
jgi:hypothetical protein